MKASRSENAPPALLGLLADPRQLRSRWLAVLGQATDGYLRSPLFLAFLRYGLAMSIEAQALQSGAVARRLATRTPNAKRR